MRSIYRRQPLVAIIWMAICTTCLTMLLCGCVQETTTNAAPTASTEASVKDAAEEEVQANELAKQSLEKASAVEPAVTQALQAFESDRAQLAGLEYRLKSQESLTRKILSEAHDQEISLQEAASSVNDVLRYTMCIEPEVYVSDATKLLKGLEASGYSVETFNNRWNGEEYKGLNTKIATPDGYVFELQIHTPQSYEVKEATHKYYEDARREDATAEEVEEANQKQREMTATITVPEGVLDFTWK